MKSILVAVLLACLSFTSATGVLHVDEITGYTTRAVNIPDFASDHSATTFLSVGYFQAVRENGFNLATVGGINFNSEEGITVSTPGKLALTATVGGNIDFQGTTIDINAAQDIVLLGSGESIISVADDVNFNVVYPGNGSLAFHSNLLTEVAAKNSFTLSSSTGDVRYEAPNGVVTLHADTLGLVGGVKDDEEHYVNIQSSSGIQVKADREFDISTSNLYITAASKFSIDSALGNIELESAECFIIDAGSNIYLSASENLRLETLLGDVSIDASLGVSLHAKGIQHFGESITLTTGGVFNVLGSGRFNLFSNKDNTFYGTNTRWSAYNEIDFIGKSDSDITISLIEVDQYSSNILVEAANLDNSYIRFQAGYLTFRTFNDDIHMKSDELTFNGNIIRLSAGLDFNLHSKIDAFTPGNSINAEEGIFTINSGLSSTFSALDEVTFTSNYILNIEDDVLVSLSAINNIYLNGIFETHLTTTDLTITGSLATSIVANNDLISVHSKSYTLNSAKDITYHLSFDGSFTYDNEKSLNPTATSITTNGFDLAVTSHKNLKIEGDAGVNIVTSDFVSFDASADDNSFTGFSIKNDMTVTSLGGNINTQANQIMTFSIPSGGATFSAGRDINFESLDDYITSVTDSIYFKEGALSANSETGIYFRAGNALDFDADVHSITFTSSSVLIDSATSVSALADQLVINSSGDSVNFHGDNGVNFNSFGTLDLSPKPHGDIDINGGQVNFDCQTFSGDFESLDVNSGDNNNIEILDQFVSFNAGGSVNINSDYVNLYSETTIEFQIGDSFSIAALKDDIVFDQTQFGAPSFDFDIQANAGDASFTSNYMDIFTATYGTSVTYVSGDTANIHADTNIEFSSMESISFTSILEFNVITGGDFDIQLIENNQEFTSTITVLGDTSFTTCNDDILFFLSTYAGSISGDLTLQQLSNTCEPADEVFFNIITHSDDLQTISSNDQFYYGDDQIDVIGGRVYVSSSKSSLSVKSASSIAINSDNGDDLLADTDDDRLWSGKNIYLDTHSTIQLLSKGFDDIANSNFLGRGIEFDTNSGLVNFTVPTDGYIVTAPNGLIQLVSGTNSDIIMWDTHDLIIEGGVGSVIIESGGNNHNDTVELDSSIQFFTAIGNILIETANADIQFESSQIFVSDSFDPRRGPSYDAGLVVESFLGAVTFTAGGSIDHSSSEMDGDFLYQSLTGKVDVTVNDDILLLSGDRYFDGSVSFTAARNFQVTTMKDQKFITTGPNKLPTQNAITLFGEEGPILFTTPSDQQFFISGSSLFDAATGEIILTARNDISFDSTSELYLYSLFDSTIDTLAGNITLSAHGGGGSVDIISDSAQTITGAASNSLLIYSEDSTSINSLTGITVITRFNDILLNQFGNYQRSLVHSGGTVVLEAERQDGVSFTSGNDISFLAQKDVLFDATQQFSIGSTGQTNTATEPIISFNAGDSGTYGVLIDVLGGIDWTTLKNGAISFDSNRATWTATGRQDYTSNGPILFKNTGLFDLSSFEISTNALFTLTAGGASELLSNNTIVLNTPNKISFTASGAQNPDTSFIKVNNNWKILATDTVFFQTGAYESILLDWSVSAGQLISFSNTVGDGGSLTFNSDWFFKTTSLGPIFLQSNDIFNVYTDGLDADIFFKSSKDQIINSGSSVAAAGKTITFESPNSVSISTTDGDIEFIASGTTFITSNGTSSYSAVDSVTIQAGYANTLFNDLKSFLNITSRGNFNATARQAIEFEVREDGEDITVIADYDIQLQNSVPTRPSDQGDILITTGGFYYFESGDDASLNAGRDIYYETGNYILNSNGNQQYIATGKTADIYIESIDDLEIITNHDYNLAAFTNINYDVGGLFELRQLEENAPGAVSFRTLASDAPVTLNINDDLDMYALGFFLGNTDGYISLTSETDDISFTTYAYGADITFQNKGTGGLYVNVADDFDYSTTNLVNGNLFVNAFGIPDTKSGGTTPEFSLSMRSEDVTTKLSQRGNFIYAAEDLQFHNPKTTSDITVEAAYSIHTRATGVEEDRFDRPYGILIETDDTISIDSFRDTTSVNSNQGRIFVIASEDLTFDAGSQISGYAGDKLLISTGFTVEPNFQIPFRSGIIFQGTTRSSYRANRGDIIFDSEDASWSATGSFNIRSEGNAQFSNPASDTQWTTGTVSFSANNIIFDASAIQVNAPNAANFVARESITVLANELTFGGTNADITIAVDNVIFLNSDGSAGANGNERPSVVINAPLFRIPGTRARAGISRITDNLYPESDKNRPDEENNWPTCEDREFTVDFLTGAICYCNYHKWRCNDDVDYRALPG